MSPSRGAIQAVTATTITAQAFYKDLLAKERAPLDLEASQHGKPAKGEQMHIWSPHPAGFSSFPQPPIFAAAGLGAVWRSASSSLFFSSLVDKSIRTKSAAAIMDRPS